jgi:hypothetical protein
MSPRKAFRGNATPKALLCPICRIEATYTFMNSLQGKLRLARRKREMHVPNRDDQTLTTKALVNSIKQNWRRTCFWILSLMQLLVKLLLSSQRPSYEAESGIINCGKHTESYRPMY